MASIDSSCFEQNYGKRNLEVSRLNFEVEVKEQGNVQHVHSMTLEDYSSFIYSKGNFSKTAKFGLI